MTHEKKELNDEKELKRKQLADEEAAAKKEAARIEAEKLLLNKKEPLLDKKKPTPVEEVAFDFKKKKTKSEDFEPILNDFIDQFGKENYDPEKNRLTFPSPEAAVKFFEEQASQMREFLCVRVNEDGTPQDDYLFSAGTGKLYQGTLAAMTQELEADLAKEPDNQKLLKGLENLKAMAPQPNFKDRLSKHKEEAATSAARPKEPENEESSLPNPLSTSPNPLK